MSEATLPEVMIWLRSVRGGRVYGKATASSFALPVTLTTRYALQGRGVALLQL